MAHSPGQAQGEFIKIGCSEARALLVSNRVRLTLPTIIESLPLFITSHILRLWFNGWPFSARFGDHKAPCKFCRSPGQDCIQHLPACRVVHPWAVRFFGDHRETHRPSTISGLLGINRALTPTQAIASALFCASLLETWTWAKHGRVNHVSTDLFRSRLRHLAVRNPAVAKAERRIQEAGYLPTDAPSNGI